LQVVAVALILLLFFWSGGWREEGRKGGREGVRVRVIMWEGREGGREGGRDGTYLLLASALPPSLGGAYLPP